MNAPQSGNKRSIAVYPGESAKQVSPQDGSIVCCGIFGVFEHTGIWLENNIVELHGSGLVKAVSPQRFLADRSGDRIDIACTGHATPIVFTNAAQRAAKRIFTYINYHPIKNNCHRFTYECATGQQTAICTFAEFNFELAQKVNNKLCWHPIRFSQC